MCFAWVTMQPSPYPCRSRLVTAGCGGHRSRTSPEAPGRCRRNGLGAPPRLSGPRSRWNSAGSDGPSARMPRWSLRPPLVHIREQEWVSTKVGVYEKTCTSGAAEPEASPHRRRPTARPAVELLCSRRDGKFEELALFGRGLPAPGAGEGENRGTHGTAPKSARVLTHGGLIER